MSDSKYFKTTKKGEIFELKSELDSPKEEKKKEAIKKVIALMTVGKDMASLFSDVVKCINTPNLELKKLVYLYIMNYAKSQPDLAILSVNTLVRDCEHANPLVRALAVRTMGCIRVENISEYLCQPLRKCLKDPDPYVRKTAAVCVAKLYDISPELVDNQGFLDMLRDLLSDSNPMVVSNAVAALSEIDEVSKAEVFRINPNNLNKLLAALNECTEWGQVAILSSLAKYVPRDAKEAESIAERVVPRLNHVNSAVVLSAVKVILRMLDHIPTREVVKTFARKMGPPLVTLLSKEPEIQYVALRNINLIVQKKKSILSGEMKVFFCKYNDPIYVKMEKLELMIMLANDRNIDAVLNEFKEYATEVDVEFVRKAVRAIGRCAIKLERAAEKCISVLLELIKEKVNYVVQEAIVVIKDIFRKYPNRYEKIIATLCENLDTLDEPEAKAAMIWILGEYAERIENADQLLETFLETFRDETNMVQLQLLTAIVKLFLKRPKDTQALVVKVLDLATKESDNPDLRDRGFVYWRLLSVDPEAAKAVVLAQKPLISDDSNALDPALLNELIGHLSTLASVFHKPPEAFVSKLRVANKVKALNPAKLQKVQQELEAPETAGAAAVAEAPKSAGGSTLIDLGFDVPAPAPAPAPVAAQLSGGLGVPATTAVAPQKQLLLPSAQGKGLQVLGAFARRMGGVFFDITLQNQLPTPMSAFAIDFNVNPFGLKPANLQLDLPGNQSVDIALPVVVTEQAVALPPTGLAAGPFVIDIAIRNNIDTFFFRAEVPLPVLFSENGLLSKEQYLQMWKSIPDQAERVKEIAGLPPACLDVDATQRKLQAANVFVVARTRNQSDNDVLYLSVKPIDRFYLLVELTFNPATGSIRASTRTPTAMAYMPLFEYALEQLLRR